MSTRMQQQAIEIELRAQYPGALITAEPCEDDPEWFVVRAVWRTEVFPFVSRVITTYATLNQQKLRDALKW